MLVIYPSAGVFIFLSRNEILFIDACKIYQLITKKREYLILFSSFSKFMVIRKSMLLQGYFNAFMNVLYSKIFSFNLKFEIDILQFYFI